MGSGIRLRAARGRPHDEAWIDDVLNRRADRWSRLLAAEERVAVHPIEGGGRFIDCGIEARGGLLPASSWRGSAWPTWPTSIVPGEVERPPDPDGPGRHRSPGPGLPGQPVRGLGDQGGEVLRDGLRPDAGRGRDRGDLRHDRYREASARSWSACSKRASRRRPRSSPRSRPPAGSSPRRSRCSSPRPPAWPAACRSSPGRSRRPCTSWPS